MARTAKKKYRTYAEIAGLYGGIDLDDIYRNDYERYVGLFLNRNRITIQSAERVRLGVAMGVTPLVGGTVPREWWLEVRDNEDLAAVAFERHKPPKKEGAV